jgi:hypothetical protein
MPRKKKSEDELRFAPLKPGEYFPFTDEEHKRWKEVEGKDDYESLRAMVPKALRQIDIGLQTASQILALDIAEIIDISKLPFDQPFFSKNEEDEILLETMQLICNFPAEYREEEEDGEHQSKNLALYQHAWHALADHYLIFLRERIPSALLKKHPNFTSIESLPPRQDLKLEACVRALAMMGSADDARAIAQVRDNLPEIMSEELKPWKEGKAQKVERVKTKAKLLAILSMLHGNGAITHKTKLIELHRQAFRPNYENGLDPGDVTDRLRELWLDHFLPSGSSRAGEYLMEGIYCMPFNPIERLRQVADRDGVSLDAIYELDQESGSPGCRPDYIDVLVFQSNGLWPYKKPILTLQGKLGASLWWLCSQMKQDIPTSRSEFEDFCEDLDALGLQLSESLRNRVAEEFGLLETIRARRRKRTSSRGKAKQ